MSPDLCQKPFSISISFHLMVGTAALEETASNTSSPSKEDAESF